MNIVGLLTVICIILFLHIILRRYENFEQQSREVIEILKSKKQKLEQPEMNYEKINLKNVEDDEGIDLETDFSLLKKDLMKYVDESRGFFNVQDYNSSDIVNDKKKQKQGNIYTQKKEYDFSNLDIEQIIQHPFGKTNYGSMEQELEQINKNINKSQTNSLQTQSLKPDLWVMKNENQMNGGKIFGDSDLSAYDASDLSFKMI